MSLKRLQNY